jgi:hypothetical protein
VVELRDGDHSESLFEHIDLHRSHFHDVNLAQSTLRAVDLRGVRMVGVELVDVEVSGEIERLVVNGVDVTPFIEAELDRRYPERPKMRAEDPAGFVEAWEILNRLWAGTIASANGLPAPVLDERVDGEWSFIQTLRHLVFATDCWVGRVILGDPTPWHRLGLPFEEMPDTPGVELDREARPSLDEVLEIRRQRMNTVRDVIAAQTVDSLASMTSPVEGPGWPRPASYNVARSLRVILSEEWEHRLFAERDLEVLRARTARAAGPGAP